MVYHSLHILLGFFPILIARIINAESKQPKTEQGAVEGIKVRIIAKVALTDRQAFTNELSATLTKSVRTMLMHTSSERGRTTVPLITNATGISPFPIRMMVKVDGVEIG